MVNYAIKFLNEEIVSSFKAKFYTLAVGFDLAKSLIPVSHKIFVDKLTSNGFSTQARQLFPSFVSNRKHW